MTASPVKPPLRSSIYSWALFLFPALALTARNGIGLIEFVFFAGALFYARTLFVQRRQLYLPARWIIIAFALNLAVAVASLLLSGFRASGLDYPFRQVLLMSAVGLIALVQPNPQRLWQGLIAGSFANAGCALYQCFVLGLERAAGVQNAIMFGDIAMVTGLMALAALPCYAGTRWAWMPYAGFAAGLCASVLSGSRGGWFAILLAFLPVYWARDRKIASRLPLFAAAGLVALAVISCSSYSYMGHRLSEISSDIRQYENGDSESSIGERLEMWRAAGKMIAGHPLFGVGRGNFNASLRELIARGEIQPSVQGFDHAHNEMLNALATEGVIGGGALLLLYGAPFVFFLREARQKRASQPYALAGILLVVAFAGCGLTQVLFAHHVGAAYYAMTVAALAGICIMQREVKP
jgi:O-antigen ligase